MPLRRGVDENIVVHVYTMEHYLSIKKILPFETARMDLEGVILSEISQSEEDKYHMISLIHEIQKTK